MRYISVWVLLLALGRSLLAADSLPISVYPCPRTEPAPVIDGKLDAAVWTRLDLELQAIAAQLRKAVGEARLKALLDRI